MSLPRLAALLVLAGLSGCFRENPVVQPGHVYDPSLEITRTHLEPYDSSAVKLVDKADSNRVILLWSGRADTLSRIPTYVAGAGEAFFYRIEGYKAGRGLCHAEDLDQGRRVVRWDSCGKSAFRLRFSPAVLALEEGRPQAGLQIAGADTLGAPVTLSAPEWLAMETSTLRFAEAGAAHAVGYRVRWELLPPGRPEHGWIRFSAGAGGIDSLAVVARRKPVDWLGMDSLDLGPFAVETTIAVTVPFRAGPDWLKVPAAPWLSVAPEGGQMAGIQGARIGLRIGVARERLPAVPRSAASLIAYGDSGRVVDSLVVEATNSEFAAVVGKVVDWSTGLPLPGIKVTLPSGSLSASTDAQGRFSIIGAAQGRQLVSVALDDGIGAIDSVGVDWAGYGDVGTIAVSPRSPLALHPWPGMATQGLVNGWDSDGAFHLAFSGNEEAVWSFNIMPDGRSEFVKELQLGANPRPGQARFGEMAWHLASTSHILSLPLERKIMLAGSKVLGTVEATLPFHPFGFLVENERLYSSGKFSDGRVVMATLSLPDLIPIRMDSLPEEDTVHFALLNGPRMAQDATYRYLVEGASDMEPTRLHRIPKSGGTQKTVTLSFLGPAEVMTRNGLIYVGSRSSASYVQVLDRDLRELRILVTDGPVERMRFGSGWASDLIFMATSTELLVSHLLSPKPIGRFRLPAKIRPLLIALKQESRIVGVACETGFYSAVLGPAR